MTESAKKRIIDAAFSFYDVPCFENVSLSQIAGKVGISKAAIFKHFASKSSLTQAMDDVVYGNVAIAAEQMLQYYQSNMAQDAIPFILDFLMEHREYIFYLLCTKKNITEDYLLHALKERGVNIFDRIYNADSSIKDMQQYFLSLFISVSLLVFLVGRLKAIDNGMQDCCDARTFARKIADMLQNGIGGKEAVVNAIRMLELERLCGEGVMQAPPVDKTFGALSAVIARVGFQGVTIEKIADELGMAKSSLYSTYSGKTDLMVRSLRTEIYIFYEVIIRNIHGLRTPGEKLYAMFQTELLYFVERPQIIEVFKSLFTDSTVPHGQEEDLRSTLFYRQLVQEGIVTQMPDIGLQDHTQEVLFDWFFALPSVAYIHCRNHQFNSDTIQAVIKNMYYLVEFGIKNIGIDFSLSQKKEEAVYEK